MRVDPSNTTAQAGWDGDEGAYWAERDDIFERSPARYDDRLLAHVGPADRVLDIGCGTGSLTRAAARRGAGAVGIDLSSAMLAVARRRTDAEGPGAARFLHGDAQVEPFPPASFDVALSRAGVMFFGDPVAAMRNVARALRPGGRLAVLVWQSVAENEWLTEIQRVIVGDRPAPVPAPEAPGPLSWSDPARVRRILAAAGFADVALHGVREPMYFGADADAARAFMGGLGPLRAALAGPDADRARAALHATIEAHAGPDGVQFGSAAWLVTARVAAGTGQPAARYATPASVGDPPSRYSPVPASPVAGSENHA